MSKNKWAVLFASVNAVLALFAQQLASGQYPQIPEETARAIAGIVALVIAFVTAFSPYFDLRQTTK